MGGLGSIVDSQWNTLLERDNLSDYQTHVYNSLDELDNYPNSMRLYDNLRNKSAKTGDHSLRLTMYALCLSKKAGVEWVPDDTLGALLHDMGKFTEKINEVICVDRLNLDDEQRALIKSHPSEGKRICELYSNGEISERAYDKIIHHHERLDGTGYPDGLTEDKISPQLRIVSICDFYDSLYKNFFPIFKDKDNLIKLLKYVSSNNGNDFDSLELSSEDFPMSNQKPRPGQLDPELSKTFISMVTSK